MHTIPVQAVRDALMLAVVKLKSGEGEQLARFGAYTRYPRSWDADCRRPQRNRSAEQNLPCVWFGPLQRGDMHRVLERHRAEAGLAGVRKTWGAGMKQLQAEFASAALR